MADEWTDPIVLRREDLQLGCHRLEFRWKFVASWPPRLQSRQEYLPCFRCDDPTVLYWTDDRIWQSINGSWYDAVLCFACLRWLVDHPSEVMHVHPARAAMEWENISRIPRKRWERITAMLDLVRAGSYPAVAAALATDSRARADLHRVLDALHLISTCE